MSARFSPFLTEAISASANPMVDPPSLCMADSKLNLVRVLTSKKSVASIFPRSMSEPFAAAGSMDLAILKMWLISSREKSLMEMMSLPSNSKFAPKNKNFPHLVNNLLT